MTRLASWAILIMLLLNVFAFFATIQPAAATGTIYIRADGSIDPPTAPVFTIDNTTYTLAANISSDYDGMVIQRDDIILDGAGYALQGTNQYKGIFLSATTNVTIRNTIITGFATGIYLYYGSSNNIANNLITAVASTGIQLYTSSSNSMTENAIINSSRAIALWFSSNGNIISANNISKNGAWGIYAWTSSNYTTIVGNNITENGDGISLHGSHHNSILENRIERNREYGIEFSPSSGSNVCRNYIASNHWGISSSYSSNNSICGNNIVNGTFGIYFRQAAYNSIRENVITDNLIGIELYESSVYNSISANTITNNNVGIYPYISDYNSIVGNNIADNTGYGVEIVGSSAILIYHNNITNNTRGIYHSGSSNNSICGNNIVNGTFGIYLYYSDCNRIFHNNFINNTQQVFSYYSVNVWDDGYPSGGNCWSDYTGADQYSGPNQDLLGSDGIGDTPYVVNADNRDNYPLAKSYGGLHDIGITTITACKTVVGQGYNLTVTTKILNYGINMENLNLTTYVNTTTIQTITNIILTSRNSTTITFAWNTTGFAKGNYIISAYASPIPGETDTTDNILLGGWVLVSIPGDINGDRKVDLKDVFAVGKAFGTSREGPNPPGRTYVPNCDIDGDGKIDLKDYYMTCKNFGKSW